MCNRCSDHDSKKDSTKKRSEPPYCNYPPTCEGKYIHVRSV